MMKSRWLGTCQGNSLNDFEDTMTPSNLGISCSLPGGPPPTRSSWAISPRVIVRVLFSADQEPGLPGAGTISAIVGIPLDKFTGQKVVGHTLAAGGSIAL